MARTSSLLSSLCLSSALVLSLEASFYPKNTTEESNCGRTPRPHRVEVKHLESKGIGYQEGYTSLMAFFPLVSSAEHRWIPYFDLRGHLFNDGEPAANVGLG